MFKKFSLVVVLFGLCFLPLINSSPPREEIFLNALLNTVRVQYFSQYKTLTGDTETQTIRASGVIIGPDLVLTCYHVFNAGYPGSISVTVYFSVGEPEIRNRVQVVRLSKKDDMCLLRVDPAFKTIPLSIANAEPRFGDEIFFVGHTTIDLAKIRVWHFFYAINGVMLFPVAPGDSGGGVFNFNGELIGMIKSGLSLDGTYTLIGYAAMLETLQGFVQNRTSEEEKKS